MKSLLSAAALASPLLLAGCIAVALGAAAAGAVGYVQYERNEAYRDFERDLDATWDATIASMRELGYPVESSFEHGPTEGRIEVEDAVVRFERHAEGFTRVRVRIGTFDTEEHRRRAGLVLEGIADRLE